MGMHHAATSDNCRRPVTSWKAGRGGERQLFTHTRSDVCRKPAAAEAENGPSRALEFHLHLFFSLNLNSTGHLCTQKPLPAAFKEIISHSAAALRACVQVRSRFCLAGPAGI